MRKKMNKEQRPSFDEYFMEIAYIIKKRSTCLRRQVGAVLVKDNRIISTGYNGAPSGLEHCINVDCIRNKNNIPSGERSEICRGVHAEQNVIAHAARFGISIEKSTLYVTLSPCITCFKLLIDAGIKKVVYSEVYPYPDKFGRELLNSSKIKIEQF